MSDHQSIEQTWRMTPQDIAVVRELIVHARANGWDHIVYGGSFVGEHVWRHGGWATYGRYASTKVSLYDGVLEYRQADGRQAKATLRPETAVEVRAWLRLLGVVPSVARVAEAVLAA